MSAKPNSLEKFVIDFEYDKTYPEIRKLIKRRTIRRKKK